MSKSNHTTIRKKLLRQLEQAGKKNKMTHQQWSDKTGFQQPHISRMLKGNPTLDNFINLADAVDHEVKLERKK